nr:PhoX family phosphatase [uncultured Dongia sp.]
MTDRHYRMPVTINNEDDNHPSNPSAGPTMTDLIAQRVSRRTALKGLLASAALGAIGVGTGALRPAQAAMGLSFTEIPHAFDENLHIPAGYTANPFLRWGEPIIAGAPDFDAATRDAAAQAQQFGYNCDFVHFVPLPEGSNASDHGLLVVNHEYTDAHMIFAGFADGKAALAATTAEMAAYEQAGHGLSVVEVKKEATGWTLVKDSKLNRRITLATEFELVGPVAGHDRVKTSADASGTKVFGTMNNCAGGWTPWGTILSAEENTHQYFGGDPSSTAEAANAKRMGIKGEPSYAWGKFDDRFDVSKEPNEPNRFGWIIEVDPYDPASKPVKHTALGRFKHEAATTVINSDGRLVVYTGDDERFEYIYKFVSTGTFDAAKGRANSALLDDGTLFVAKLDAEGKVTWMPLVHGEGELTEANGFKSQADVLIEARRASDLLKATKMDRPEDIETSDKTGKVYVVLTKNDKRKADQVDAANTRAENKWGHIVEMVPPMVDGKADHAATSFTWSAFIQAGNPADTAQGAAYGGAVTDAGWFANPDNVAFDANGRLWISTDGFPDHGVHDGLWVTETEGEGRAITRHFLGCPRGAELCGPAFTPDGKTLFVAVQHPGDEDGSNFANPTTRWPDFKDGVPPRPTVVAITKDDGGDIGA